MPRSGRFVVTRTMYASPTSSAISDDSPAPVSPNAWCVTAPSASTNTSGTCTALITSSRCSVGFVSPAVANATASMPLHTIGIRHAARSIR